MFYLVCDFLVEEKFGLGHEPEDFGELGVEVAEVFTENDGGVTEESFVNV
jgi:hypothetical protein